MDASYEDLFERRGKSMARRRVLRTPSRSAVGRLLGGQEADQQSRVGVRPRLLFEGGGTLLGDLEPRKVRPRAF